jgi:hypothetical protein
MVNSLYFTQESETTVCMKNKFRFFDLEINSLRRLHPIANIIFRNSRNSLIDNEQVNY